MGGRSGFFSSYSTHVKSVFRTSSNNRRSCTMLATAFILTHFALLMYFNAKSVLVCLCWTTRTYNRQQGSPHTTTCKADLTFPNAPFPTLRKR